MFNKMYYIEELIYHEFVLQCISSFSNICSLIIYTYKRGINKCIFLEMWEKTIERCNWLFYITDVVW